NEPSNHDNATTFIVTGALLVLAGLLLDSRGRRRAAFWWHVVGLGSVAVGLVDFAATRNDSGAWAAMLATGIVVLLLAAPLGRATWAAYGVAGGYSPLVHYVTQGGGTWRIPLILLFVSLLILFAGIFVRLYGAEFGTRLRRRYRF